MATQKESIIFHDSLLTTLNKSLRTSLETNLCIYNMFFLRSLFVRINRGASELSGVKIGKIKASEASRAVDWGGGKGGGAWRHAFNATVPVPWCQILVSCSDCNWVPGLFPIFLREKALGTRLALIGQMSSRWQIRGPVESIALFQYHASNIRGKIFKHGFRTCNTYFFARIFAYPLAPRRAKNMLVTC